jgi:ACS family hexuronate transporter-like MFS transporter
MSVSYVDRQALAVLAPTVREALSITREEYGRLLAAFSFAYLLGAPFAGALVDRVGARRGLVASLLVWSLVAAGHALVPTFGVLFAMRIALGLAEAPSFPGATQTVRRILPADSRSAGFGLLFTGSSVGAMIAAPLAIAIHHSWGSWRLAFVGTAVVGLAWIPAWLLVTRDAEVRRALATVEAPPASAPTSRLALVPSPQVLRALLLVIGSAPSIMFALNWMAQYLTDVYAIPQDALGPYIALPPLFFDAGSVLFGALASRGDRRGAGAVRNHRGLVIAASLLASVICGMPAVHSPWGSVALASISLSGGGALFALLTADMIARVHPAHASTAGGLTAAAQSLAYIVAAPAIGAAVDRTHSYAGALALLGGIVPVAGIVWALWPVTRSTRDVLPLRVSNDVTK